MFNIYQWCQNHKVNLSFNAKRHYRLWFASFFLFQNDCHCRKNTWYFVTEWIIYEQARKRVSKWTSKETRNEQSFGRLRIALQKSNMKILWQTCYKCGIHVRLSEPEKYFHLAIVLAWIHLPLSVLWIVHMVEMIQRK